MQSPLVAGVIRTTVAAIAAGNSKQRKASLFRVVSLLVLVFSLTLLAAAAASASGLGYDVSFPSGTGPYPPAPFDFGIVGVTGGRPFSRNAYLSNEYSWAAQATAKPQFYINLAAPIGSTSSNGSTGPYGTCAKNDKICLSNNYGYNAAQDAYNYAAGVIGGGALSTWWLDIETGNSWWPKASQNQAVIAGAIHFFTLNAMGVGIYSSSRSWQSVTGGWNAQVPNWVWTGTSSANDALKYCGHPLWGGGQVVYTQYSASTSNGTFDADYACP